MIFLPLLREARIQTEVIWKKFCVKNIWMDNGEWEKHKQTKNDEGKQENTMNDVAAS